MPRSLHCAARRATMRREEKVGPLRSLLRRAGGMTVLAKARKTGEKEKFGALRSLLRRAGGMTVRGTLRFSVAWFVVNRGDGEELRHKLVH